ncbi:MAG: hypothetical protein LBD93_08345 [Treponema sp.]|nr:hypothetical protein [Treponema sp.]
MLGIIPHEDSGGLQVSDKAGKDLKELIIDTLYRSEEIGGCGFIVKGGEQKKIPRAG